MDERLLVVLLLPILLCPSAVSAASTQGLAWGLSVGDRVDYTVTSTVGGATTVSATQTASECYVVVTSLPDIPSVAKSIPSLQIDNVNQSFTNGTEYYFIWTAVPIGNWTLLSELLLQSMPSSFNATIIDTQTEWGFESPHYTSNTMTMIVRMSKADGAMNYLKEEVYGASSTPQYVFEVARKSGLNSLNMVQLVSITVTLASLGVIAVFGVLIIRKRSSEPFSM